MIEERRKIKELRIKVIDTKDKEGLISMKELGEVLFKTFLETLNKTVSKLYKIQQRKRE